MTVQFMHEIDHLKAMLLEQCAVVEQTVRDAVHAFETRDPVLARRLLAVEDEIDRQEVAIEEECLKILALHQPVAVDLRYVVAILKMNNDLERMADLADHIADNAVHMAAEPGAPVPSELAAMADKAVAMVKVCLDAVVELEAESARMVIAADDEVNTLNRAVLRLALASIEKNPQTAGHAIRLIGVARHLERIADHATNIAEDVLYTLGGEIVRHRSRTPATAPGAIPAVAPPQSNGK